VMHQEAAKTSGTLYVNLSFVVSVSHSFRTYKMVIF
jgi:hypothetical protein